MKFLFHIYALLAGVLEDISTRMGSRIPPRNFQGEIIPPLTFSQVGFIDFKDREGVFGEGHLCLLQPHPVPLLFTSIKQVYSIHKHHITLLKWSYNCMNR
jgi:hypothetical protein